MMMFYGIYSHVKIIPYMLASTYILAGMARVYASSGMRTFL
jgi:hypothetical protein